MILSNQVKCLKCGDEIYSAHVHDFKTCGCGAVSVDGGQQYLRWLGNPKDYEDMSIEIDNTMYKEAEEILKWCTETNRNDLGRICAIFRVFRDNGYELTKVKEEA